MKWLVLIPQGVMLLFGIAMIIRTFVFGLQLIYWSTKELDMLSLTDQTGAKLAKGDAVTMCFGIGMVNGTVLEVDFENGMLFLGVPLPFDPTKPVMNISKTFQQPKKLGTV